MTSLCICFRYSLCSIGFMSSPKIKYYNVFWPSFPSNLTHQGASAIHLNGTSPSKCRHSLCWHTKGHLWIEGCLKHYRWAYYELHLSSIQLVIFTFRYVKSCTQLFIYATCVLYASIGCCISRTDLYTGYPQSNSCVIHEFPVLIPTYIYF